MGSDDIDKVFKHSDIVYKRSKHMGRYTFIRYKLPEYWAGYLINGCSDNLSEKDIREIENFMKLEEVANCLDCGENAFFTNLPDYGMPGACLDYVFIVKGWRK